MKKIVVTLVAVVASISLTQAQVGFGIKAGVNLSNETSELSGSFSETSDARLSGHFGAFVVAKLFDKIAIQPEFIVSMEGGKDEGQIQGIPYEGVDKFTFINVPVLLRISPVEMLNLYVGPQFGINVSAKYESEVGGNSDKGDIQDASLLNLGLGLGLGFNITKDVEIGLRYNLGVSNLYNGDVEDYTVKINTLQIGLAYRLF